MERKSVEKTVTIVLSVVFIFLLIGSFSKPKKPIQQTDKKIEIPKDLAIPEEIVPAELDVAWGRDPFIIPTVQLPKSVSMTVSAIVWDEKRPLANIDGEIVGVGQQIEGFKVIQINKTNVIVNNGEGEVTLELYGSK